MLKKRGQKARTSAGVEYRGGPQCGGIELYECCSGNPESRFLCKGKGHGAAFFHTEQAGCFPDPGGRQQGAEENTRESSCKIALRIGLRTGMQHGGIQSVAVQYHDFQCPDGMRFPVPVCPGTMRYPANKRLYRITFPFENNHFDGCKPSVFEGAPIPRSCMFRRRMCIMVFTSSLQSSAS